MEKVNQSIHCSQGFPQTVISFDYFQSVGFGFETYPLSFNAWRVLHRRYLTELCLNSFLLICNRLLLVATALDVS